MSVFSKFLSLQNGVPRTVDLSTNTLSVQGLQINAASGGGAITQVAHSTTTSYSVVWPQVQAAGTNYALVNDGSGNLSWVNLSSGSVTSVALADGSTSPIYSISGSPVTSSGTLTFSLNTQSANTVFAGPTTGSAAQPGFRSLVSADIPDLSSIYLALSGGTMSGAINMGSNAITNMANPTNPQDAATKLYVDNLVQGLSWKSVVNSATTGALPAYTYTSNVITASSNGALPAQDGVTLVDGNRLLVKDESGANQPYNGIYVVTQIGDVSNPFILTRSADANTAAELEWATVQISPDATTQGGYIYRESDDITTIGTDNVAFANVSQGLAYVFTSGVQQSGNTVSAHVDNSSIDVNGSNEIEIKAQGVSPAKLGAVAGNGLTGGSGSALAVQPLSGSAIAVSSSGVSVSVGANGGIEVASSALQLKLADTSLATSSSGVEVNLATSSGLVVSSGLAVNPDGSTIDINGSDQIEVKAGGIGTTQLASASVTPAKLGTITDGVTLDQSGSGSTLEIKSGGVGTTQLASNAVTDSKIDTSVFDQDTITGGGGSAAVVQYAPLVKKTLVAGESFAANTSFLVRWGLNANSESTDRVYKADQDTSSYDLFWCIGIAQSSTAVSAGQNIPVIMLGHLDLGSSDTDFATGDVGKPVYLTSAGAFSVTAPSTTGDAVFKIGNVESTSAIWIEKQLLGVN